MSTHAAAGTYGPPLAVFAYDPELRKSNTMLGLGMSALAFAFPVLYWLDPSVVPLPTLAFTPLCLLVGISVLVWVFLSRGIALELYGQGLVYKSAFGTRAVAYQDIVAVRYHLVHVMSTISHNRGLFEITLRDGSKLSPSMQLAPMDKAIGAVIDNTLPRIVEETIAILRAGGHVAFGPYELHPQGIMAKGKAVRWPRAAISTAGLPGEIRLLDVDPDGEGHAVVLETKTKKVPNSDALEAVAEKLRAEAIRRGER